MYINNTGTLRKERLVSKESEVLCGSDKGPMLKTSALLSLHGATLTFINRYTNLQARKNSFLTKQYLKSNFIKRFLDGMILM